MVPALYSSPLLGRLIDPMTELLKSADSSNSNMQMSFSTVQLS